jgi:hypothetical protein
MSPPAARSRARPSPPRPSLHARAPRTRRETTREARRCARSLVGSFQLVLPVLRARQLPARPRTPAVPLCPRVRARGAAPSGEEARAGAGAANPPSAAERASHARRVIRPRRHLHRRTRAAPLLARERGTVCRAGNDARHVFQRLFRLGVRGGDAGRGRRGQRGGERGSAPQVRPHARGQTPRRVADASAGGEGQREPHRLLLRPHHLPGLRRAHLLRTPEGLFRQAYGHEPLLRQQ